MVGIGRANYVDYETGTIERFDPAVIKRIAELYEVPVTDLLDHYNAFLMSGQGEQVRQWRISLGKNYKEMVAMFSRRLCLNRTKQLSALRSCILIIAAI